jgi:hypothetical protein
VHAAWFELARLIDASQQFRYPDINDPQARDVVGEGNAFSSREQRDEVKIARLLMSPINYSET